MTKRRPEDTGRVLIIAGSDSGGGAGIQADIKTCAAFGAYAATAITAVTAQNTVGVQKVEALSPDMVKAQIDSVLSDIGADVIKIGMLANQEIIEAVAAALDDVSAYIILDPVRVATSGDKLLEDGARHLDGPMVVDVLVSEDENAVMTAPRIRSKHTHGTGCTLASAIAANMALGVPLDQAVNMAREFVFEAIRSAPGLGAGHGPLNHGLVFKNDPPSNESEPDNPFSVLKSLKE